MKRLCSFLALTTVVFVCLLVINKKRPPRFTTGFHYQQLPARAPAKDAAEWLSRLAETNQLGGRPWSWLYPELPPPDEWPPILKVLLDPKSDSRFASLSERCRLALNAFGHLLSNDHAAAARSVRQLDISLVSAPNNRLHFDSMRELVFRLADDPREASDWLESKGIRATPPSQPSHTDHAPQPAWRTALDEGRIEHAIAELRAEAASNSRSEVAIYLAKIAHLLGRGADLEDALTRVERYAKASDVRGNNGPRHDACRLLWKHGQVDAVRRLLANFPRADRHQFEEPDFSRLIIPFHLALKDAGPGQALELLKQAPAHGIRDRANWLSLCVQSGLDERPFGLTVAEALESTGRNQDAALLVRYLLKLRPGNDSLYQALLRFAPAAAPGFIESLQAWDMHEERPLIWRAKIALDSGEVAQAAELIGRAIAMDPSDGE